MSTYAMCKRDICHVYIEEFMNWETYITRKKDPIMFKRDQHICKRQVYVKETYMMSKSHIHNMQTTTMANVKSNYGIYIIRERQRQQMRRTSM